jgi:hypothetical protein
MNMTKTVKFLKVLNSDFSICPTIHLSASSSLVTNTVIPWFTSVICTSKTAHEAKTHKTKINFREALGTTIGLREEGARISENWLVN